MEAKRQKRRAAVVHTYSSLRQELGQIGIDPQGTLLVHSSFKSIGNVEGGPDTVLDALSDYMKEGLLVLPTHTWDYVRADNPKFYVDESPSCVGILPELFRKRPGVVRSKHPTHSVAALGADAVPFTSGDELCDTPCARSSAWGKLLDRKATIMLLGVDLTRNTFMHGVEEWLDIPGRLTDGCELLYTVLSDGTEIPVPSRRHIGHPSEYFGKVERIFEDEGVLYRAKWGDASILVCDTVKLTEVLTRLLTERPDLFSDDTPLS
jgi:aminoglycoside 3-N-acetyltransferase